VWQGCYRSRLDVAVHLSSSTFRNYTHSELRFRALLTEVASEVELALV
jgi:hypothetical protein